jgi:prophage regulatory protein
MHCLPETGYLRLTQIIGNPKADPPLPPLIPVGKSTWWAGVKAGRYPAPVRTLGARITAWRAEDIRAYIEGAAQETDLR